MVVRLRLQRMGLRNTPFYRIVAADARAPRDGKFLEKVSDGVDSLMAWNRELIEFVFVAVICLFL